MDRRAREAPTSLPPASRVGRENIAGSIIVRLLSTHNHVLRVLREGFAPDLTLARFDLLMQLLREEPLTLATLSRRMLVTAGNLTGLVERAERDGLVVRNADPNDRRVTLVTLTTRGRSTAERAIATHDRLAEEILAPLDDAGRDDLRRTLGALRQSLRRRKPSLKAAKAVRTRRHA
jgi:DNA-binding MarR family transcriptional regulator